MTSDPPFSHDRLPTVTIVETETSYIMIACGITISHAGNVGIVAFHTTLDAALFHAEIFLHHENDPKYTSDPPTIPLHDSHKLPPPQTRITISDRAWQYIKDQTAKYDYRGTAAWQGMGNFLLAMMHANPQTSDWVDTRHRYEDTDFPDAIRAYDTQRLKENKFPVWSQTDLDKPGVGINRIRKVRSFPLEKLDRLIPLMHPIATHFGITAYRGANPMNARVQTTAFMEAYGLQYITPLNDIPKCSMPRKRDRTGYRSHLAHERIVF